MFKINLIPEAKQQQQKVKKVNVIVTTVAVVVAVILGSISLLLGGYIVTRKAQIMSIDSQTSELKNQLKAYSELEKTVLSLETGIKDINNIVGENSKWTKTFTVVEAATPNDIRFKSFTVDANNVVSVDVEGGSVKSIDRFIKSFTAYQSNGTNAFTNVDVDSFTLTGSGGKVSFQAKFTINEQAINGEASN